MDYTQCNCMDLSTAKKSPFFRVEGDFCLENSARMLCEELGVCGHWGCDVEDFMCPSHDFRRNYYLGYGYGDCSAANHRALAGLALAALSMTAASQLPGLLGTWR